MTGTSSFPWLIILAACLEMSQANMAVKVSGNLPQTSGVKVMLKCDTTTMDSTYMDFGAYWVLQKPDYSSLFILYVSTTSKVKYGNVRGYEASKGSTYYQLTITHFQKEHQGIYFCIILRDQALHLGSGLPVFLPESTTRIPTTLSQVSTISTKLIKENSIEDPYSTMPDLLDDTNFQCDLYIWAPLTGGCVILFIILVITIVVCKDPKRRRRKCRCKRPMNGANGANPH